MNNVTTMTRTRNPETGMVYRGASDLIHIADGQRAQFGADVAAYLQAKMRRAERDRRLLAGEPDEQADAAAESLPLCPGCYMVAMFDATLALAQESGQSITEMARTMAAAFDALARDPSTGSIESIAVQLDAGTFAPALEVA